MKHLQVEETLIHRVVENESAALADSIAVEEPLAIMVEYSSATGRMQKNIAITMRTPGDDETLAAGFLFTEGIIRQLDNIRDIRLFSSDRNRVLVTLKEDVKPALHTAERNFYSTSSCGVCGKTSIESLRAVSPFEQLKDILKVNREVLFRLPGIVRSMQVVFNDTGGIHACALFDAEGNCSILKEDIGRHNALDKLIGTALLEQRLPLNTSILFLSGRAGFELIQKAAMAGIKMVAAVGAPSSLSVELAKEYGITLVGFLKEGRFNIYNCAERII